MHQMKAIISAGMCLPLSISGCATAQVRSPTTNEKIETRLLFAPLQPPVGLPPDYADQFLWSGLERYKDAGRDGMLREQCIVPPATPTSAFLAFLIGPLVSLATDTIKSGLDEELKKYAADFKAAEQTGYWRSSGGGAVPAWRCFRVVRMRTQTEVGPDGKPLRSTRTIDFDFIGQVATVGPMDQEAATPGLVAGAFGTKVRPLRVFLGRPIAKGSRVGVAANVTFDAVWRQGGEGKKAQLFSVPVLERKFVSVDRGQGGERGRTWSSQPYYYPDTDADGAENPATFPAWGRFPLLPLVPIGSARPEGTALTVTFSATEVGDGDGKGALKTIIKLFAATKSDIDSELTKAGKKLVDPQAPTPPAAPDKFCGTFTPSRDGTVVGEWTKTAGSCPTGQ